MRHKIRVQTQDQRGAPTGTGDYLSGYDRLAADSRPCCSSAINTSGNRLHVLRGFRDAGGAHGTAQGLQTSIPGVEDGPRYDGLNGLHRVTLPVPAERREGFYMH